MATGRQRHERYLVFAQAQLVGALFTENRIDHETFIATGTLASPAKQLHYVPGVEEKIREIERNGGKLIVQTESPAGEQPAG
jgi:hypothetical protein